MKVLNEIFKNQKLSLEQFTQALKNYPDIIITDRSNATFNENDRIKELQKINLELNEKIYQLENVQIPKLNDEIKNINLQHNKMLKDLQKEHELDLAIIKARGKNIKAIKALIDLNNISFDKNGNCPQLQSIMKSDPYLFDFEGIEDFGTGFIKNNPQISNLKGLKKQFENALNKTF